MTPDWTALLAIGDFSAARAAWQEKSEASADSPEASWELAEIEERWGDAFFFAGEPGAAAHFQAARTALVAAGDAVRVARGERPAHGSARTRDEQTLCDRPLREAATRA